MKNSQNKKSVLFKNSFSAKIQRLLEASILNSQSFAGFSYTCLICYKKRKNNENNYLSYLI